MGLSAHLMMGVYDTRGVIGSEQKMAPVNRTWTSGGC